MYGEGEQQASNNTNNKQQAAQQTKHASFFQVSSPVFRIIDNRIKNDFSLIIKL
jgi:hypothetical protein